MVGVGCDGVVVGDFCVYYGGDFFDVGDGGEGVYF